MTLSEERREADVVRALQLAFQQIGDNAINTVLLDSQAEPFEDILPTTWADLKGKGWVEQFGNPHTYRLTGTGWINALAVCKGFIKPDFAAMTGEIFAAMKRAVKDRTQDSFASVADIARTAGTSNGLVFNIVDSQYVERRYGKRGASWGKCGNIIRIPSDFYIEPVDGMEIIDKHLSEAMDELTERVREAEEEAAPFHCPTCGAPMTAAGEVQYDADNSGNYELFACGFGTDGIENTPCPSGPHFPPIDEYQLEMKIIQSEPRPLYECRAIPKTNRAQNLSFSNGRGRTEEEAINMLIEFYNRKAKPWKE